jgi:hypothetical protein
MERNTFATSIYIDAPVEEVTRYLLDGMSLNEYTLFSRMREQIDDTTWRGTASGYQAGLYYHVRHRDLGSVQIVEWHCGAEYGKYHHVYPMLLFKPGYFSEDPTETGTYYHWVSFVDPRRATPMIVEGMPAVHGSEARSLKAQLEKRRGHRRPVRSALQLRSHTIYVEAPIEQVAPYLADETASTEWGFLLRRDGATLRDEYDHALEIEVTSQDLGAYRLIEHATHYTEAGTVVRTPILLVPSSYAFGSPEAPGLIMHRITAWPEGTPRSHGKSAPGDYDAEAINAKRIIEAKAGNLEAYARGCSYVAQAPRA